MNCYLDMWLSDDIGKLTECEKGSVEVNIDYCIFGQTEGFIAPL